MNKKEQFIKAGINTRFSSTNQPIKKGRKPSKLKKLIKDHDISTLDLTLLLQSLVFVKNIDDLTDIINDHEFPFGIKVIVKALITDYKHGKFDVLDKLIERVYGKPVQKVENDNVNDPIRDLNPAERKEYLAQLIEQRKNN